MKDRAGACSLHVFDRKSVVPAFDDLAQKDELYKCLCLSPVSDRSYSKGSEGGVQCLGGTEPWPDQRQEISPQNPQVQLTVP